MRYKRQNFIAVQSHHLGDKSKEPADSPAARRIAEKLEKSQERYSDARSKRPPPWVPTEKIPRALTTSASACRKLMKKAEMMGIVMDTSMVGAGTGNEVKRKWNMQPAFTPDFVNYFFDRDIRLANYKSQLSELIQHSEKLNKEERSLRTYYNKLSTDVDVMRVTNPLLKNDAEKYWKMLRDISGQKLPLPSVLRSPKIKKTPQKRAEVQSPTIIHLCGICKNTHDQHQLLQCDTCKSHYHLGCLDPPLTRMPKKTAFAGWQCSKCVGSSSDEEMQQPEPDEGVTVSTVKRVRRTVKEPSKYTPALIQRKIVGKGRKKRKQRQRAKKEMPEIKESPSVKITKSPSVILKKTDTFPPVPKPIAKPVLKPAPKSAPKPAPKPPRPPVKEDEPDDKLCNICNESGTLKTLVSCDECEKCYHFGCLDPPYKKNPKVRGYGWYCPECISEEEDED